MGSAGARRQLGRRHIYEKEKGRHFSCEVSLPKNSEHQFRYRLDGTEWIDDPQADALVHNEFGGTNSFIQI